MREFRRVGWEVWAAGRSEERLAAAIALGARPVVLDLTDPESVRRAAAEVSAGGLDVLVSNAGAGLHRAVESASPDEVRDLLATNLTGPAELARLLLPALRSRRGRIVAVTSVVADLPQPMGGWYAASKAGLGALLDSWRRELAPEVRVVDVRPGPVATGWQAREAAALRTNAAGTRWEALADRVATAAERRDGRGTDPDAVARVVLRAASAPRPRARYLVGYGTALAHRALRLVPPRAVDAVLERALR